METLKEKTAKGLFWGAMNNGVQQLIGLVFGIILGRLLSPSDYGMMAMILIFMMIANALQNSGFAAALANIKEPKDEDYNSVFWFNILMGTTLYVILFFCAPLIGEYYHTEKLVPLSRYAFLGFVFASFGTVQNTFLFKNYRAKQQAKAAITAVLVSSITGAVMAFYGMGYWALATQSNLFVLLNTMFAWHYSSWRPSMRNITFAPVRRMFGFSSEILVTTIMSHVNNNVLNILLGRYYSAHDTGDYNQAYQWNFKCFNLVQSMVNQVAQPVLVDLKEEKGRQVNAFRKMMRFDAFLSFPLLFGFGMVAKEFIVLTIGEKWLVSAGYIQILCFAGAVMPLTTLLSNMIISKGRSDIFFWCTFGLGAIQIIAMVSIWRYGIHLMVVVYTLLNVAWLFVWYYFTWRLTGYRLFLFLKDILPFALSAFGVMAITHYATSAITNLWVLLLSRILLAMLLYYLVMKIAGAEILHECQKFVMSKFRKNR